MTILDRYVLRQFLQIYLICFLSLTGLFIVFDAFSNLDEFLKVAKSHEELFRVMGQYYVYRAVMFFDLTCGMLVLISAQFTMAWLQRHREYTVMLAAGIPARRIIRPVLIVALMISLLAVANRELLLPRCREELTRDARSLDVTNARPFTPRYDNETDILFRGERTVAADERIDQPSFLLPGTLHRYGRQLAAAEAFYRPPASDRPGGYLLKQVSEPTGLAQQPSLELEGAPVIITPHDAGWLEDDECFVVSNVSFEQLTSGREWQQFSSTVELIRGLHNRSLDFGANVRVIVHHRLAAPFLDMTLLLLGLPLMLRPEREKPFVAIGKCMIIVSTFNLSSMTLRYLGSVLLIDPSLAVWLSLLVFVPVAAWNSETLFE